MIPMQMANEDAPQLRERERRTENLVLGTLTTIEQVPAAAIAERYR